ncbi:MAG: DUF4954 family protein, partial [Bacteroidetes bacterium]|nr:DUF4954 family protein [Bacteroidota bacterium]
IHSGKIKSWNQVHSFYQKSGELYEEQKLQHAWASLAEITGIRKMTKKTFSQLLQQALATREWMVKEIYESRAKDYHNEFRKMVYENTIEMDKVIGKLDDNSFINQQVAELKKFKRQVNAVIKAFKLS